MKYFHLLLGYIIGGVWSLYIIFIEFISLLKNGFSYFKSPETLSYPDCVKDRKYGKSKFIEIETTKGCQMEKTKLKLHYIVNGESNQLTMLLIHGFPEFWFSWRHQIIEFSENYRVIAIDMRGYGLSDKPAKVEDYQMKHLINDIKSLLDALELRSVILVAHDWGGAVAWSFENVYPEMVDKLIALNIPENRAFMSFIRKSWKQFFKSWYIFFFQYPYLPEWKLSRFDLQFISLAFTSKHIGLQKLTLNTEEVNAFKANMAQPGCLTAAINYYRASFRYSSSLPSKSNPKRKEKNRYMLLFGGLDKFIEVACAEETKVFVPNVNLKILPGLSHWVQQDDPETVNNHIKEFLKD